MMRLSGEIAEPLPAFCLISFGPFDDCGARGSEDPRDKGDILCLDKEEFDHGLANRPRVLGISAQKSSGEIVKKEIRSKYWKQQMPDAEGGNRKR